jgi:hypothetical protein
MRRQAQWGPDVQCAKHPRKNNEKKIKKYRWGLQEACAVELRALTREHAAGLVDAAADGELWKLKVTVVPGPATSSGRHGFWKIGRANRTSGRWYAEI